MSPWIMYKRMCITTKFTLSKKQLMLITKLCLGLDFDREEEHAFMSQSKHEKCLRPYKVNDEL